MSPLRFFIALSVVAASTIVGAQQEVTYDDLVNELAARRRQNAAAVVRGPFDEIQVHAGFGLVNSFSTFRLRDRSVSRYQNGLELSAGVDLFSPNWFAEAAWRNFGLTRNGSEEHMLRELDLKFGFRDDVSDHTAYRLQAGLADRTLRVDDTDGLSIRDRTPALLGSAGLSLHLSPNVGFDADLATRLPVVGTTADKGAWDFSLTLKVSL